MTEPRSRIDLTCARSWLIAALLVLPAGVRADAHDALLARAVAAKERALEINDPPHWEEAMRLFSEADRARSTKESKYELGLSAAQMHAYDLAVESYEAALDLGIVGTARTRAESFVAEQASHMGRLEILGPPGCKVLIRDQDRGTLPLVRPIVVFAGEVEFAIVRPDHGRELIRRTVRPGAVEIIQLGERPRPLESTAVPPTPPPAPAPHSAASARLPVPPAPMTAAPAPPAPMTAAPAPPAPMTAAPAPATPSSVGAGARSKGIPSWPFLVSGLALAAAGGILVGLAPINEANARSDLDRQCAAFDANRWCTSARPGQTRETQEAQDAIATWQFLSTLGWVGIGTGTAVATFGAVLLATKSPDHGMPTGGARSSLLRPDLRLTPGGLMLLYGGPL